MTIQTKKKVKILTKQAQKINESKSQGDELDVRNKEKEKAKILGISEDDSVEVIEGPGVEVSSNIGVEDQKHIVLN